MTLKHLQNPRAFRVTYLHHLSTVGIRSRIAFVQKAEKPVPAMRLDLFPYRYLEAFRRQRPQMRLLHALEGLQGRNVGGPVRFYPVFFSAPSRGMLIQCL